jgi:hypothetical protein
MSRPISHQVICRALNIISDKRRWTQRAASRSPTPGCGNGSDDATRYCAFAAMACAANEFAASASEARELALRAEAAVIKANRWPLGTRISQFNDRHTHEAVIAALMQAVS